MLVRLFPYMIIFADMKKLFSIFVAAIVMATTFSCKKDDSASKVVTPVPDAVDLGIMVDGAKLKWASFNLGASECWQYGDYYAWGATDTYYTQVDPFVWKPGKESGFDWPSYPFYLSGEDGNIVFSNYTGSDGDILAASHDVATVKLGGKWRIPTREEWELLFSSCELEWTTVNDRAGLKVSGNGNSIFLPAAARGFFKEFNSGSETGRVGLYGYYWSSELYDDDVENAWAALVYEKNENAQMDYFLREFGLSVRPVYEE